MSGDLLVTEIPTTSERKATRYIFEKYTNGFGENSNFKSEQEKLLNQRCNPETGESRWTYPLRAQFTHAEVPLLINNDKLLCAYKTVASQQNDPDPCPKITKAKVLIQLGLN